MDLYALGSVGMLVLALAFMFGRFGGFQGAKRGGEPRRNPRIPRPPGTRRHDS